MIFAFLIVISSSCEDETDPIVKANGFALRTLLNTSPIVLDPINDNSIVATLEWDKSDNGVDTKESSYQIEIALGGTNFANPILANLGSSVNVANGIRNYSFKVKELNDLALKLPNVTCGQSTNIDVRIKSKLGDYDSSAFIQYSTNFVTINVSPYSSDLPVIAFANSSNNLASAAKIISSSPASKNNFEGYFYLTSGNYKFYKPDSCGDFTGATAYGGSGGVLSTTGSDIVIANTGYYVVKADLVANTYTIKEYKAASIFGQATRTGFGSGFGIPMTDTGNKNIWTITMNLLQGVKFKFKTIVWTGALVVPPPPTPSNPFLNLPYAPGTATGPNIINVLGRTLVPNEIVEDFGATTGEILVPGVFASGTVGKSYKITLDLSNPRAYTYKLEAQ